MIEISQYLVDAARMTLRDLGDGTLPKRLENGIFWLAAADDKSVTAYGAIEVDGRIYKIGEKRPT